MKQVIRPSFSSNAGKFVGQPKATEELHKSRWRFDPLLVPGPDRNQILYVRDVVLESPTGETAAVVYSINEVLNNWYVGLLAIVSGDSTAPQIRLRPNNFVCTPTLRWLGSDRYLSVQMSMYHRASKRHDIPFCIFDLELELHTFYPFKNPCATIESENGSEPKHFARTMAR